MAGPQAIECEVLVVGAGNDIYVVDDALDVVTEAASASLAADMPTAEETLVRRATADDVRAAVNYELRSDRLDLSVADVVSGLCEAIRTPMGEVMGGRSLADIPVSDRLAELDFDLPLHSDPARRRTTT